MIQGILFDFDGTLVDSNHCKVDCFYEVASKTEGATAELKKILSDPDSGDRYHVFRLLAERLYPGSPSSIAKWSKTWVEEYTSLTEVRVGNAEKREGLMEALDFFKESGLPICISSATPEIQLQAVVNHQGITQYFSRIMGSPNTKIDHVRNFRSALHSTSQQLVYIGDSEIDQECARSTGCHFIGVGDNADRFDVRPERMISDLSKLSDLIGRINAKENLGERT